MSKGTLEQHRKWCDKSQLDVAKALGVTVNSVFNYESGKREPKFSYVLDFADWLGIDIADIIIKPTANDDVTEK